MGASLPAELHPRPTLRSWDWISCSPGWSLIYYVAVDDLDPPSGTSQGLGLQMFTTIPSSPWMFLISPPALVDTAISFHEDHYCAQSAGHQLSRSLQPCSAARITYLLPSGQIQNYLHSYFLGFLLQMSGIHLSCKLFSFHQILSIFFWGMLASNSSCRGRER